MCGIAGLLHFDFQRAADPGLLAKMGHSLRHRGPDSGAVYTQGPAGLAHRRLKIIDLSDAANQPMLSEDGRIALVYNGECYNYLALREELAAGGRRFATSSDTEVVLALYETYGADFPQCMRGMFSIAIWDDRLGRMLLVRDRLGIKPLYYSLAGNTLAFASELKALLELPWISRELDPEALGCYFRMYSIPDPLCAVRDVHRLEPGQMILADSSGSRVSSWWDLSCVPRPQTLGEAAATLGTKLSETVKAHLVADVPVGVSLSGGLDSSVIAALAAGGDRELHSFSFSVPGSEHDEGPEAASFAVGLGCIHHELCLPPLTPALLEDFVGFADEPFAVSSGLGVLAVAGEAARTGVKVLLTGDGGDELFGGYRWRHQADLGENDPAEAYARKLCFNGEKTLGELLEPKLLANAGDAWMRIPASHFRGPAGADALGRRLYTEVKTTLVSEMLAKSDRMTMAHGVEGRVPFLDHELVELAFSFPQNCKIVDGAGKAVLRRAAAAILPPDVLRRPKKGFNIPIADALVRDLPAWTLAVLLDTSSRRAFYKPGAVERLYAARVRAQERFSLEDSHRLFAVLSLELWLRRFIDP